jgi:3-oxoadipate enol-lactonase
VPVVEVNGARLWYDEAGQGDPIVLLHGGLGDSGLWEPVVPFLAERFRTIRTDFRFFGRSAGPVAPYSLRADALALLDELCLERVVLVGLSLGGTVAFDLALDHPERVRAVAGVAPTLSGEELEVDLSDDLAVWTPLGVQQEMRRLWQSTPFADPLPPGVTIRPPERRTRDRLAELAVPALVVTVSHDPQELREVGPLVAREASDARHIELDSDHYVTLREPEALARVLLEFLPAT